MSAKKERVAVGGAPPPVREYAGKTGELRRACMANPGKWCSVEYEKSPSSSSVLDLKRAGFEATIRRSQLWARWPGQP